MKALYLESVGGIAGDMFTAAFLDAGVVDSRELNSVLEILALPGVDMASETVRRRGVPSTRLELQVNSGGWKDRFHIRDDGRIRMYEIVEYISGLALESQTMGLAREILLIHASARIGPAYRSSGVAASLARENDPGQDQAERQRTENPSGLADAFDSNDPALQAIYEEQEVVDLMVDAVFAAHCVRRSEATAFFASPLRSGGGMDDGQRNPAYPAAELFRGLPVLNLKPAIEDAGRELSTPTGLSILRALDPSFLPTWPEGRVRFMGVGAGQYESSEFSNVFRIVLLDKALDPGLYTSARREPEGYITIEYDVRCGLKPDKPERLAGLLDSLERHGARDVRLYQRKDGSGKPGLGLGFLCNDDDLTSLSDYLLTNTTAFG
ncbi:MAG: DUF111 family protein, partial [Leptospiraceae bacterium]|nr:DUF111 family protein [Leptospiraceae bacterium]